MVLKLHFSVVVVVNVVSKKLEGNVDTVVVVVVVVVGLCFGGPAKAPLAAFTEQTAVHVSLRPEA